MYARNDRSLDKAFESVEVALELDNQDSWAHGMIAFCHFLRRQDDKAEIHFNRSMTLNQNNADVIAFFGNILVYLGRWEEGLTQISKANRLNPYPPDYYYWYHGLAFYAARDYRQAILSVKQIRVLDRWHHGLLAMCYGQLGQNQDAGSELASFMTIENPEADERRELNFQTLVKERVSRYRNETDREHFLEGMRRAGLLIE